MSVVNWIAITLSAISITVSGGCILSVRRIRKLERDQFNDSMEMHRKAHACYAAAQKVLAEAEARAAALNREND